jgi:hypothetical protein
MTNEQNSYCRICGFRPDDPPWGVDGRTPSHEICPSCAVEYGYEDSTPAAVTRYRNAWLKDWGRWSDASAPRDGLTSEERLRDVPDDYRPEWIGPPQT